MSEEIRKEPLNDKAKIALLESRILQLDDIIKVIVAQSNELKAEHLKYVTFHKTFLSLFAILGNVIFPIKIIEKGFEKFEIQLEMNDFANHILQNQFSDIRLDTNLDESGKNLEIVVVVEEVVAPKEEKHSEESETKKIIPIIHNG